MAIEKMTKLAWWLLSLQLLIVSVSAGLVNVALKKPIRVLPESSTCGMNSTGDLAHACLGNQCTPLSCPSPCTSRSQAETVLLDISKSVSQAIRDGRCSQAPNQSSIQTNRQHLIFDGNNACRVSLNGTLPSFVNDELSVSMWVKHGFTINSLQREVVLLNAFQNIPGDSSKMMFAISLVHNGNEHVLALKLRDLNGATTTGYFRPAIQPLEWTHVALQGYSGIYSIFMNGTVASPRLERVTPRTYAVYSYFFEVGNVANSSITTTPNWEMRDVQVYNATLTNREIYALYKSAPVKEVGLYYPTCRCPPDFPEITDDNTSFCKDNSGQNERIVPRVNFSAHLPEYANDGRLSTSWVSAGSSEVTLQIDLLDDFIVTEMLFRFVNCPRAMTVIGTTWGLDFRETYDPVTCVDGTFRISVYNMSKSIQDSFTRWQYRMMKHVSFYFTKPDSYQGRHTPVGIYEVDILGECNCFGHASSCDASVLPYTCQCQDNTEGSARHCDSCVDGSYRPSGGRIPNYLLPCVRCGCHPDGTEPGTICSKVGGVCTCKANVHGDKCDTCKAGFYGLSTSHADGCIPCNCHPEGTVSQQINACHNVTGKCQCKETTYRESAGRNCEPFLINSPLEPSYGPKSGGPRIALQGGYLQNVTVLFGTKSCIIENQTDTFILMRPPLSNESISVSVKIYSNLTNPPSEKQIGEYTYRPDPVLESIEPTKTILRGGIPLTMIGRHMDSSAQTFMLVYIVYQDKLDQSLISILCKLEENSKTRLICPTPHITLPPEYTSRQVDNPDGLLNEQGVLQFYLGLQFETYYKYANISAELVSYGMLQVYQDPVIHTFSEPNQLKPFDYKTRPQIDIKGERLTSGANTNHYMVQVGQSGRCTIADVTSNQLTCSPPTSKPVLGNVIGHNNSPRVLVTVGYLNFTAGYLDYPAEDSLLWPIVGAAVGAFVLIVVIIVVLVLVRRKQRQRRRAKKQMVHFNTYDRRVNMSPPEVPTADRSEPLLSKSTQEQLSAHRINIARIQLSIVIGQGQFGRVYEGQLLDENLKNPTKVAIKTLKGHSHTLEQLEEFLQEAIIMKDFHHINVLSLHGVAFDEENALVVLPYMHFGDLKSYIAKPEHVLNVGDLLHFGMQIANGMAYLAAHKFVHRDLAARNCMINAYYITKIADFGLSRDIFVKDYYRMDDQGKHPLPVKWMALESLTEGKYSTQSDVWSFGIVLNELLTRGKTPYPHVDNYEIKNYIASGRRLDPPDYCPDEVRELMLKCWAADPDDRPTFTLLSNRLQEILVDQETCNDYSGYLAMASAVQEEAYVNSGSSSSGYLSVDVTQTLPEPHENHYYNAKMTSFGKIPH